MTGYQKTLSWGWIRQVPRHVMAMHYGHQR
jgi:hypothetical protein